MATEYKLSYTAAEIDERLSMVSDLSNEIDRITETVTINENLILFDSKINEIVNGGYTNTTGYITSMTNYSSLPPLDVNNINQVTINITSYTPIDPESTECILYKAFLDENLNVISGTRTHCQMYGIMNEYGDLTNYTTANIAVLNTHEHFVYGMTATIDIPVGVKYLSLFNLKKGDIIDITVYVMSSNSVIRLKENVLPDSVINTIEQTEKNTNDIAQIKNNNIVTLSEYAPELINNIAIAAKEHMKSDSLCFVLYTDTHYTETDTCYQTEIARQLAEATNASAILHLGDLAHMHTESKDIGVKLWQRHSRILHNTKVPYFQVVGNHDDGNIYTHNVTKDYSASNYLSASDMYFATTKQSRSAITNMGSVNGWYYFDDEDSKVRFIILNSHEYPWIVNDDGTLAYDSNAKESIFAIYSPEQLLWLANTALNFSEKGDVEEQQKWSVLAFAHMGSSNWANVNVLFQDFKTGTKCTRFGNYSDTYKLYDYTSLKSSLTNDFSLVGARKIAFLTGDVHRDNAIIFTNYQNIQFLNASPAKDHEDAPTKTKGTPTETAISILVVTPSENKITELRFGAGTRYDVDGNPISYDPLTDYDNYRVFEY